MSIGFNVYPMGNKAKPEVIEKFESIVTPHISDNMHRLNGASSELRPYHRGGKLVGSALTVRTRPGDNLMIHKAINMAEPGDVLVVDAGGETTQSVFGEILLRICQRRGVAGLVVDGCIRDIKAIQEDDFPVYAKGVVHRGPYKDGPGEINVPVTVAGMIVNPGDIIVGDEDGIVSVPYRQAEDIISKAEEKLAREEEILKGITEGDTDKSWLDDEYLQERGCKIHDTEFKV